MFLNSMAKLDVVDAAIFLGEVGDEFHEYISVY